MRACVSTVSLRYYGRTNVGERALAKQMGTTSRYGADPGSITKVARRLGFQAEIKLHMRMADLEQYARKGVPVIVAYQAWADHPGKVDYRTDRVDGHYSVVVGMDTKNIYFEDPSAMRGVRGYIRRDEFATRWHDTDRANRKLDRLGIVLRSPTRPVAPVLIDRAARTD